MTWDAELINMLYLSPFCIYIKLFLVVAFHAGVYWPLLGVWQIQSCYLAVGRMLKFSAPTLTQARYCIHTTLKNPKNLCSEVARAKHIYVPVLAFSGMMLLWDVSPYPICYICFLSLCWWCRIPSWCCQYYTFVLAASLLPSSDVPVHYKRWKWLHLN